MQAHVLNAFATAVSNDNIRWISDWPDHRHPQGYTEAKDDVIEQAYTSQVSITRRIPSQPAHPLWREHEKPREDRGGRSVEDGAEGGRRRVRHNQ